MRRANDASTSNTVGDIDFQVIAGLHQRPSRSDEAISSREERAGTSGGVGDVKMAQHHNVNTARKALPFWLDLVSISGCMSYASRNVDEYGRKECMTIAVQFFLDYSTSSSVSTPFDTDLIYE
eukprot:3681014-Pyramimonas_sp.AAC.1